MKKYIITLLFCTLFCHPGIAQGLKSVSILGDSYSTFEGYVQPDTNFVWYLKTPPKGRKTDMVSVRNTWWHQFIKENNYRLCVNNSFSGATICHTGYRSEDSKSFCRPATRRCTVLRIRMKLPDTKKPFNS